MGLKAVSRTIAGAVDYETGSWTPTLGVMSGTDGSHTYSTQVGRYIKIGNLVWVQGHIKVSSLDGAMSGATAINGLPYAPSNVPVLNGPISMVHAAGVDFDVGYTKLNGRLNANLTKIEIIEEGDNLAANSVMPSQLSNPHLLVIGTYSADLT